MWPEIWLVVPGGAVFVYAWIATGRARLRRNVRYAELPFRSGDLPGRALNGSLAKLNQARLEAGLHAVSLLDMGYVIVDGKYEEASQRQRKRASEMTEDEFAEFLENPRQ